MRRFVTTVITILYFLSYNASYALSELYYLKNVQKDKMQSVFQNLFITGDYKIKTLNPVHATGIKDSEKYVFAVFQQSGQNMFYYYSANTNEKKYNKNFLKYLKEQDITYQQSFDADLLKNFETIEQKAINGIVSQYNFDTPQYQSSQNSGVKSSQTAELSGYVAMVGKGSKLDTYLQSPINTSTAQDGDLVNAVLKSDWVINNTIIAEQGSVVGGYVVEASPAARGMRNGKVVLKFNQITTPNGRVFDIESQKIDFKVSNEGIVSSTVTKALVATAAGALVGLLFGVASKDYGKAAAIGAGIGAGASLVESGVSKGVDAEIPAYTDLEIILDKDVKVVFRN